jgi:flagellar basal-body rod modification protein FlgD
MSTTATSNLTYSSPLIGQAEIAAEEKAAAAKAASSDGTLGESDFLTLLVAQLQQQDPLNPMDDSAYVAELAQFSSLEQLTNISSGISTLTTDINEQGQVSAVNFIGKNVTGSGNTIVKSSSDISSISYNLSSAASDVQAEIYDSSGSLVDSVDLGAQSSGTQKYTWDGKYTSGSTAAAGTYTIALSAQTSSGTALTVTPQITGTVTGVSNSSGTYYLTFANGQEVSLLNITSVNNTTSSTSS